MKTVKRYVRITMLLVLTFLVFECMTAQAATTKKKALAAYKAFLEQNVAQRNARGAITNSSTAITRFDVIYLNKDSVPELVVERSGLLMSPFIYTYKNGKMVAMNSTNMPLRRILKGYYKKKSCILLEYESNGYPYHSFVTDYCVLKGKNIIFRLQKQYVGTEKTVVSGLKYSYNSKNTVESGPTKMIGKSSFNSKLKKIVGNKKMTKFKLADNTEQNRSRKLK